MRNFTNYFLFFACAALIITSCSTSSDLTGSSAIQKRRYTKGYHLNIPGKYKAKPQQISVQRVEPVEVEPVTIASAQEVVVEQNLSASIDETKIEFAPAAPVDLSSTQSKPVDIYENQVNLDKDQSRRAVRNPRLYKDNTTINVPVAAPQPSGDSMILYIILAILIPPLAVGLLYGITGKFWISLLLTLLFYIPGMIYSLIVVLQY